MSTVMSEKGLILDTAQVAQKIKRMAFEIYENNFKEKSVVLAGIEGQGYVFAQLLGKELGSISEIEPVIVKVSVDKQAPQQSEISIDIDDKSLKRKCVILVDDVLNTGRTLAYSLKPLLNLEVRKIEVAVLVNRSHPMFPIMPAYTGLELSTTLNEHVEVVLGKKASVYLR